MACIVLALMADGGWKIAASEWQTKKYRYVAVTVQRERLPCRSRVGRVRPLLARRVHLRWILCNHVFFDEPLKFGGNIVAF